MTSESGMKKIQARISGPVCALVLCSVLAVGLWPFQRPWNAVTWLGSGNGLRFGDDATILSSGAFQMEGSLEEASCSLEIWLQSGLTSASNSLLSFSTPENAQQFSLHQYFSSLILKRQIQDGQPRAAVIGIEDVFRQIKPKFITITSGTQETAMYVDGALASTFPRFRLGKDFTGQLVIGTSPVINDSWSGQLRGLAIYHRELTPAQVFQHYQSWTTQGRPQLSGDERMIALYLLNEHAGRVVHNAVQPGIDLRIPKRYSLLHQEFLEPLWREYKPGWRHWASILLNIVGFIPVGFFICAYWSSLCPTTRATLAITVMGLAVSLTIEVLQSYLPTRNSGTTDLLTNTLGTFLGVRLYGSNATRILLAKVCEVL